jgi:hypothetical protein
MTVYDKAKWHPDDGFEHIGRYLDWVIRRDTIDPDAFESEHLDAIAWQRCRVSTPTPGSSARKATAK